MKEKIAVLGPEGTFSHQAAQTLNGKPEIVFYKTIHDVFDAVDREECDKGVVPIENSLGGSVGFTLDALLAFDLKIELEEIVPIVHCLIAVDEVNKGEIKYVYAHNQSYSQCEKYLRKNLPDAQILETTSNGESAKLVQEKESKEYAAIGPELAAGIYNLEVLQKSIQDSKFNVTKFVVISKSDTEHSGYDRTSITVYPQVDRPGLLWEILGYFKNNNVNLSKIESRPSKGKLGDYIFYIDLEGHITEENPKKVITELEKVAFVKILGSYPRKY
ncbi:MAG: prephenate dehydratase [bacterium]|nr:prephenate dehydratase [bacterium]